MKPTYVLKFGGTSLQNTPFIRQAVQIINDRSQNAHIAVVASAIDGTTDKLVELVSAAKNNPEKSERIIEDLRSFHLGLYEELISNPDNSYNGLTPLFEELQATVQTKLTHDNESLEFRDQILSFGERLSVRILSAALHEKNINGVFKDAHHFVKTDALFGSAKVQEEVTRKNLFESIDLENTVPVITGYIGSDQNGNITTLGRSGSDYTASLVADALDAARLEIWTDVNGVLTADPKVVPAAETIESLNFEDVAELADHGLSVLHPKTIQPIRYQDISLHVRNSYDLEHPGTLIDQTTPSNGNFKLVTVDGPFVYIEADKQQSDIIKTIIEAQTTIDQNLFNYLKISADERAQFLIPESVFEESRTSLKQWSEKKSEDLLIREDIYKVKKFTNSLRHDDTSIGELTGLLSRRNIRPLSITRNYRQRFVQLLLTREEAYKTARAINHHPEEQKKSVSIFIAGIGEVGSTLKKQIEELNHPEFDVHVMGYCNSKQTWLHGNQQSTNWPSLISKLANSSTADIIFVDATGNKGVAKLYPQLFEAGIHVVTPSKHANTLKQRFYGQLRKKASKNDVQFKYETTVGAGLPVISTIQNLQQTGDEITHISGVISGTMTYIFNQIKEGIPFSRAVVNAQSQGYAEPDPRDDLSGEDVARKFLTLARETGAKIEREELKITSLVPDELKSVDAETFLKRLPEFDDYWVEKHRTAKENDASLQYVGNFDGEEITIGLREVQQQTPLGQLQGTSNFIRIFSRVYSEEPLIIQGPGAGMEVTASGVLADILNIANSLHPSHTSTLPAT